MGHDIVQEVISSETNVNVTISFKEQHVLISSQTLQAEAAHDSALIS